MSNYREVEESIHTDFSNNQSYSEYLSLNSILNAQHPVSSEHDEMLFIIIHQASELWMKLIGCELQQAISYIKQDELSPAFKVMARVKQVLNQLMQSWNILSTMTPVDYLKFRDQLGHASGFQSYNYRKMEFLLGNKNTKSIEVFSHLDDVYSDLNDILSNPGLYDEVIALLHKKGFAIDNAQLSRDVTTPYRANQSVEQAWLEVYTLPDKHFKLYELAEKLMDIEDAFQQWRFRHLYTVQRIIGFKTGTGGSSGVPFLKKALDISFFPEILSVRNQL